MPLSFSFHCNKSPPSCVTGGLLL
ncbi:hypothetical protein MUS_4074 [Bacillus velezensis YAU B9601-Y2]|uniref:Uncharacterized protein n=1 Tax=Bacillus amyloliquefaciens (strain Y2) TaxID=1155777 RepID=I2CB96_BACAY|nr:hypothetical protein MUS_4074 [Bacillus velezensis YAU B9601-Y2]